MYYCRCCDNDAVFKFEDDLCPTCTNFVKANDEYFETLMKVRERYLTTGSIKKKGE